MVEGRTYKIYDRIDINSKIKIIITITCVTYRMV
jgi:hypothetical protein